MLVAAPWCAEVMCSPSSPTLLDDPRLQPMAEHELLAIKQLLSKCTDDERRKVFTELRAAHQIHELETTFGATAEVILEAIHRAPELTRRMLRGVIADAAFAQLIIPHLTVHGWKDATPEGNFSFDHLLEDQFGQISVQVKLQRSAKGRPVITTGTKHGLAANMYMVEPQRTRGGSKRGGIGHDEVERTKTRPYRYGDFDVLAVSLQPSSGDWATFRYTVGSWLLPGKSANEIAKYQPVAMQQNDDWTDDFAIAAKWVRSCIEKRISNESAVPSRL